VIESVYMCPSVIVLDKCLRAYAGHKDTFIDGMRPACVCVFVCLRFSHGPSNAR